MPIKSRVKNSNHVDNATSSTHDAKAGIVRAIIVAPTRELASQIQREVRHVSVQSIPFFPLTSRYLLKISNLCNGIS